eukprot:g5186.t1
MATGTSTGEKCRFLLAKENDKLKTVFSNYLSLGQFELARGVFQRLKHYNGSEHLLDTLIILGPPKEWLYSISVPSSSHLGWLCSSLREELYGNKNNNDGVSVNTQDNMSPHQPNINVESKQNIARPIPRWIIQQHELDILLTTALLDGAALKWQSLSPNTVNTLRRFFFKSLSRHIDVDENILGAAGNSDSNKKNANYRTTGHIFECATTVVNRLPSLHFLPVPGFLPPVASYLPEENINIDSKIDSLSGAVMHQFKTLMLSQPLIGLFIWKDIIDALGDKSKEEYIKLQAAGVQLIAQCLLDEKNDLVLYFLQCLRPPHKNAAVDEGVRDILTAIIDLIWAKKTFSLLANKETAYKIESQLTQRLKVLSGKAVFTGNKSDNDQSPYDKNIQSNILPRKKIYEALLISENTQLLSYFCSIEDANIRLRLESAFKHFWGDYFTLMWVTKRHCLEYVIEHGLKFIHEQNFDAASQLLKPFPQLQALVLLLSVDHPSVANIEAKQKLIDALWSHRMMNRSSNRKKIIGNNYNYRNSRSNDSNSSNGMVEGNNNCSEPKVERWCDQLSFMVRLAWWYTDQYNSIPLEKRVPENVNGVWRASSRDNNNKLDVGTSHSSHSVRQIANAVLKALETNSVVRVVRECLPSIPGYIEGDNNGYQIEENIESKKATLGLLQFLSERPRGTKEIENEHQQDMMLLRAYYAMKIVFSWFYDAVLLDQSKTKSSSKKGKGKINSLQQGFKFDEKYINKLKKDSESIVRLLSGITSLPIRLTALENVFSLLFLNKNHMIGDLKNEELKRSTAAGMAAKIVEDNAMIKEQSTSDTTSGTAVGKGVKKLSKSKSRTGLSSLIVEDDNYKTDQSRPFVSYIASASLLKLVLSALKQCLETAKQEWEEMDIPQDGNEEKIYETTGMRTKTLMQYVEEGIERVNVLELSKQHFKRSRSQFMRRMFASPQSLLNVCLKRSDYKSAKGMIEFFKIPNVRSNEVMLAEALDSISTGLRTTEPNATQVDLSFVKQLINIRKDTYNATKEVGTLKSLHYKLHAFYMTVDLAISAAPTIQQSYLLLQHAQSLLHEWKNESLNGKGKEKDGPFIKFHKQLHKYFSIFVIKRYGKLIDNEKKVIKASGKNNNSRLPPLWKLLKRVENMPIEPTILESHLSQMQSRVQALDNLKGLFDNVRLGTRGKQNDFKMDKFLQSVLEQFSQSGGDGNSNNSISLPALATSSGNSMANDDVEMQYLATFLTYIMDISNAMKSAKSQSEDQSVDFLSIVSNAPRRILSSLLFESNGFQEAKMLAKLMRIDLLRILLRSCFDNSILNDEGGDNNTPLANKSDASQFTRYPLSMKVVEYVAILEKEHSVLGKMPFLASLACMKRWTSPLFDGNFLAYALNNTAQHPSLNRWVCSRAQAFYHFITIFLEDEEDPDASMDKNDDNNQIRSIKDFISFDPSRFDGLKNFQFQYATEFIYKKGGTSDRKGDSMSASKKDVLEIPKDLNIRQCLVHLLNDDAEDDIEFYELCVNRLKQEKDYKRALALADAVIYHHKFEIVQGILRVLIETDVDNYSTSHYIKRMHDHIEAAEYTIQYLERLDVDTGIDLLNMCASQLRYCNGEKDEDENRSGVGLRDDKKRKELHRKICSLLKELNIYKQVLLVAPDAYKTWQKLATICRTAPEQVIRKLLSLKQHKLAGRIINSTTINDVEMKIDFETSYIYELLTVQQHRNNKSKAFERLEALNAIEAAQVYKRIMNQIHDHDTKLILVKYMIYVCSNATEDTEVAKIEQIVGTQASLSVIELSLNILVQLPNNLQDAMRHLIGKPSIIVESLLMGSHISIVAELLKKYPKLIDGEMIFVAARKAVSMAPKEKYRHAGILTGNLDEDTVIRANHYYDNTPNMSLTKSILDISAVDNPANAGKACFRLCDHLSASLSAPDAHITMLLSMLRHLLVYAKSQFEIHPENFMDGDETSADDDVFFGIMYLGRGSSALWKQCDKYISCFTLLRTLHMLDLDDVKVKLTDMSQPVKMRKVRDVLFDPKIDRIRLALQVCKTCSIEEEPVYSAWGLALVRVGLYKEAREKFSFSLSERSNNINSPRGEDQTDSLATISGSDNHSENVKMIVRQIVDMIKVNSKGMGIAELRKRHTKLSIEVMARSIWNSSIISNPEMNHTRMDVASDSSLLPLELQQECLHYLETYSVPNGDSKELVAFFISQNMIKEACKVVVSQHLPTNIFVDIVVTSCIQKNQAGILQSVLGNIDSSLSLVRHYLIGMCNWLSIHQKHQILKDFQVFMNDHLGAAFTCEKLFEKATGFDEQMGNLRQVKEHFTAAVSQGKSRVDLLSLDGMENFARNDLAIKGRIVVIDYQMAILKLFPSKKMNPIFAVGVASEDEKLKTTLNIKRKEILAQILPIDKSLHNQLVNIFGF